MAKLSSAQIDAVAKLFRVLAEPSRLEILQELRRQPRTVGELVETLHAKQANISKQLGILFDADLLNRQRSGNCIVYSIREPAIFKLCEIVCGKLRRDAKKQ